MAYKEIKGYDARWNTSANTGSIRLEVDDVGLKVVPLSAPDEYLLVLSLLQSGKRLFVDKSYNITTDPNFD